MGFENLDGMMKKENIDLPEYKGTEKRSELENNSLPDSSAKENRVQHVQNIPQDKRSKAPYNFVPLNKTIVWAQCEKPEDYDFFNCFNKIKNKIEFNNTGYIDLEIETLEEMFIGHKEKSPDFFSINKVMHIPGSTLRGLIRTYVEIISYGKFGSFDDRHLYFRTFASNSAVMRDLYNERTKGADHTVRTVKNVKAGYLFKKGPAYFIRPAQSHSGSQYDRYNKKHFLKHFQWQKIEGNKHILRSGPKFGRKRDEDTWIIEPPNKKAEPIELFEKEIKSFYNDLKRGGDKDKDGLTDLIAQLDKDRDKEVIIPCFYVQDTKGTSFGHTKLFRLMYEHTIAQAIPESHFEKSKNVDLPEAIFGRGKKNSKGSNIKQLAGRVFFEDSPENSRKNPSGLPEKNLRLLGPNPTSMQHYLVQKSTNKNKLSHYDSPEAELRGNKLYWHKKAKFQTEDINQKIDSKIKPVGEGTRFKGRIRFENLSKVELGALLSALELPEGCRHKIGMGKSKGLGSIRITPALYMSNRKERYTQLFQDLDNTPQTDFKDFCNAFNDYVLEKTNKTSMNNIWDTKRLKQFKHLLTYRHVISPEEIDDQKLEDFKQKRVLPEPGEII